MRLKIITLLVFVGFFVASISSQPTQAQEDLPTDTETTTATETLTATDTPTSTATGTPTDTPMPTLTLTASLTAAPIAPYPGAPLCPDSGMNHNNSLFHTLWDNERGCHYDHEHGTNPFTQSVVDTFPGMDLFSLLGNVQIGHTNPSSSMENTMKHGGMKWDVTLSHSVGCASSTPTGVNALVVQYHAFGDYSIEFDSRVHSTVALLRQCKTSNPTDYGYVFVNQFQDYGQRVSPYQGAILPYPNSPVPAYPAGTSPYLSVDCVGTGTGCRSSLQFVLDTNANAQSTWISKPIVPKAPATSFGSFLFSILFRVRDNYQLVALPDSTYPFVFKWLCSTDGGVSYTAVAGCRYNNTTTRINELQGEIPASWDNLAGFDTNPVTGRITAEGYVTDFGTLAPSCTEPGTNCHPIRLINAFTGKYLTSFALLVGKSGFNPDNLPERDIYFCNGVQCSESSPGAVSSGWVGGEN